MAVSKKCFKLCLDCRTNSSIHFNVSCEKITKEIDIDSLCNFTCNFQLSCCSLWYLERECDRLYRRRGYGFHTGLFRHPSHGSLFDWSNKQLITWRHLTLPERNNVRCRYSSPIHGRRYERASFVFYFWGNNFLPCTLRNILYQRNC